MRPSFKIAGLSLAPGTRQIIRIPVSVMPDHTPVNIAAHVQHGRRDGPTVLVSAAVHGDEIIGVEIVRRLLGSGKLKGLRGTFIAIPIVNQLGFISRSRYLPDRRDLNRSFPGSVSGSLAARLAHIFLNDLICLADVGIDLHSAAIHRTNLPQIRITPGSERLAQLANSFGAPVVMTQPLRPGSLRAAAKEKGVDVLLYEAGEALRFDEKAVRTGVNGVLQVMSHLGMVNNKGLAVPKVQPLKSKSSYWVRAPVGGLLRTFRSIGEMVTTDSVLGAVADPFGEEEIPIHPILSGLIVGRTNLPLVNEGDALFHIANVATASGEAEKTLDELAIVQRASELFDDDDEII